MPTNKEFAEIDMIIDRVLNDDDKAHELKQALHKASGDGMKTIKANDEEESEDLWDDVPV